MRRAAGFTLVEILVALAVLAIALTAAGKSLGDAVDITGELRERILARWVAEDRLAEIELRGEFPALDTKEGDAEMGGHRFHWIQETGATPYARMRRVELSVMPPGGKVALSRLTGFVEQTGNNTGTTTPTPSGGSSLMGGASAQGAAAK